MNDTADGSSGGAVRQILRKASLFRHLDEAELDRLEAALEWFVLPGGATLFDAGDASDALYVLRSGSLGAFRAPAGGGPEKLVGLVAAGESVGELGLIVDQPRSASVRALRDSDLLRLSRAGFNDLVRRQPTAMLEAARVAVERLLVRRSGDLLSSPRTLAILPHDAGVDARAFADALSRALSDYGTCRVLVAGDGVDHTSEWFSDVESAVRFVLYVADDAAGEWRDLCVRQADALVLVADATHAAGGWHDCANAEEVRHRPRHLVLRHPRGEIVAGSGAAWLARATGARLHHWRGAADIERIARLIAGRSLGLVCPAAARAASRTSA